MDYRRPAPIVCSSPEARPMSCATWFYGRRRRACYNNNVIIAVRHDDLSYIAAGKNVPARTYVLQIFRTIIVFGEPSRYAKICIILGPLIFRPSIIIIRGVVVTQGTVV